MRLRAFFALLLLLALALSRPAGTAEEPASLRVDVEPQDPYLGQEITLRVRLQQRVSLAEDPQYVPPMTTGFWSDRPSGRGSYYVTEGGGRVLVTETRTRLYPLAVGEATISEATASIVLAESETPVVPGEGRERLLRSRCASAAISAESGSLFLLAEATPWRQVRRPKPSSAPASA